MNAQTLDIIDLFVSNALIIWLALRLVKRVDTMDNTLDQHETRITVGENRLWQHDAKKPVKDATARVDLPKVGINPAHRNHVFVKLKKAPVSAENNVYRHSVC